MNSLRAVLPALALAILFLFIAHDLHADDGAPRALPVSVSIAPQKHFVERIGGDLVDVNVMVPPGASAHTYEPRPRQMQELSRARIYFTVGLEFEQSWMPRFRSANPAMRIVATDEGIDKIAGCGACGGTHLSTNRQGKGTGAQAPEGHDIGGLDPHVWLSPRLVRQQARHIYAALREADPANAATYARNYTRFLLEIAEVERRVREALPESHAENPTAFLVYHPAWGYFAQDFGLEQLTIEVDGKEPGPRTLRQQIETARARGVQAVLIQPQESTRAAQTIARELNVQVVEIDPLAEEWGDNLVRVAAIIRGAPR